jgi:GDP-4-dehydro-6-deoxy-D-mannose reductase
MALRAFITGIAGFAGSHLADHLLEQNVAHICGVSLPGESTRNIEHIQDRIELYPLDLADYHLVRDLLDQVRPDCIFHLAAQASVGRSWLDPAETLTCNMTLQLNLLQAIVELGISPRILVIGSADEYGLVHSEDLPIDEDTPLRPLNPYAVSKIMQDYLGYQYHMSHGLHVVRMRPFNHIGPRQGLGFVVADFAHQIARIEQGLQPPVMQVGNLSAQRDFTDVRDTVRGYYLALLKGQPGAVYNLGSSRAYSMQQILDMLLSMSQAQVRIETDPERMRPSDVSVVVSDCSRLRADTGWEPTYHIETSLDDVLTFWRQRVQMEKGGPPRQA